jgi:monoamine oxidase
MRNQKSVIVVGGGIAGLVAASKLANKYQVVLLEALPRVGGRIYTLKPQGFSSFIEGGAEFVHGDALETIALIKSAGLKIHEIDGQFYKHQKEGLVAQEGMIKGWDSLLEKMRLVKTDLTLIQFLDLHFPHAEYADLRQETFAFAEGFDLADLHKVSVKSLYEEWSNNGPDYRIEGGYLKLINFLLDECIFKGCRIVNNSLVEQIIWEKGLVNIVTTDHQNYSANYAVLTMPLGTYHKNHQKNKNNPELVFKPKIDNYLNKLNSIGFGSVIKVIIEFNKIFWQDNAGFIFSDQAIPTWWTQLPQQVPILTGWKGGPEVLDYNLYTDEEILAKSISSLSAIFQISTQELEDSIVAWKIFNWQKQEFVYGAYSYSFPETADALKTLHEPIEQTLFFTGEALYSGNHPGTVEAAIVSANRSVGQLNLLDS